MNFLTYPFANLQQQLNALNASGVLVLQGAGGLVKIDAIINAAGALLLQGASSSSVQDAILHGEGALLLQGAAQLSKILTANGAGTLMLQGSGQVYKVGTLTGAGVLILEGQRTSGSFEDYIALTLPNVPSDRRTAVATACTTAASTLAVSAESIVDALATPDHLVSLLVGDGCMFTTTAKTTLATNGDRVQSIQNWKNATTIDYNTNRSGGTANSTNGLVINQEYYNLPSMTGYTALEMLFYRRVNNDPAASNTLSNALFFTGGSHGTHVTFTDGNIYDGLGVGANAGDRIAYNPSTALTTWHIYSTQVASGTNGKKVQVANETIQQKTITPTFGASPTLFAAIPGVAYYATESCKFWAMHSSILSSTVRAAIRAFISSYYV